MALQLLDLTDAPVDYLAAWERQREVHADVVAGAPDAVILLEHPPVYTAGKRTEPHERPQDGTPVIDVDRGGKITFHGPGQLVGYPIVRLPDHVLVVDYVRRLEEALIGVCRDLGVTTVLYGLPDDSVERATAYLAKLAGKVGLTPAAAR